MPGPEHSLRRRLLIRLWLPLLGVLMLGSFVSAGLVLHFGNVVHDRWLLDSAMALATQVRSGGAGPRLTLPPSAVEIFEWDSVDHIYADVVDADGGRLFGNAVFPPLPDATTTGGPRYFDGTIAGHPVRIVAISVAGPPPESKAVIVQVAETIKKREQLVREMLLMIVPLQAIILLLAGAFLWFAVTSSLATLDETALRLRRYTPRSCRRRWRSVGESRLDRRDQSIDRQSSPRHARQQRFVANAASVAYTVGDAASPDRARAARDRSQAAR
jgi:two-component system sensor histidine kinase TctE